MLESKIQTNVNIIAKKLKIVVFIKPRKLSIANSSLIIKNSSIIKSDNMGF